MATATETQYFSPLWMGCVEPNETVHMVNDGNGNSNGIVGKWVVDPFCDGNGNRKKHICVTVIAKPWPFCTGKTGILGVPALWARIRPCKHCSVSIMGRKSISQQDIANCGCPGHDVISNVQEMAYAVIHSPNVLTRRYKSSCALFPGSLFCFSSWPEYLNTPLASWVTVSFPWASNGHLCSF